MFETPTMRTVNSCFVYGRSKGYLQLLIHESVQLPSGEPRAVSERVHRIAMMAKLGIARIPAGVEVSHLCHEKNCVNINH